MYIKYGEAKYVESREGISMKRKKVGLREGGEDARKGKVTERELKNKERRKGKSEGAMEQKKDTRIHVT